jgi:hypothetical protein
MLFERVLIGSTSKLGNGLGGVLARRNLNRSLALPTTTTWIVGTPHMVFTNSIMTIHVNKTTNWPPMNSIVVGRYKSVNAMNLRRWYQKPYVKTTQISNHKDGHYVRPNKVVFKYPNFLKNDDPNAHVRVFNFVVKANVETCKKCIIIVFNYKLKDKHRTGVIIMS